MRKLLFCLSLLAGSLVTLPVFCAVQQRGVETGTIKWYTNYDEAVKTAKETNKPILLFFTGTGWCPACMRLEQEILSKDDFSRMVSDKFVFVKLDFPRNREAPQQNSFLQARYDVRGYPTIVIIDVNGNKLGDVPYRPMAAQDYAKQLLNISQR